MSIGGHLLVQQGFNTTPIVRHQVLETVHNISNIKKYPVKK